MDTSHVSTRRASARASSPSIAPADVIAWLDDAQEKLDYGCCECGDDPSRVARVVDHIKIDLLQHLGHEAADNPDYMFENVDRAIDALRRMD